MTDEIVINIPEDYIRVLDKGYVGLRGVHGSDRGSVSPPSAARTSFKKDASEFTDEQNDRLINYLMKNEEFACFRHNVMTFELRMPLMVARQIFKYVVGSNFTEDQFGWNENSRRYITDGNEFYLPGPGEWRTKPDNAKQGSGDPLPAEEGKLWTADLEEFYDRGEMLFNVAMEEGIAPEQARLFLPAYGLYVTVQWTTSLNALIHFLNERLDSHAQYEIRVYAEAVKELFKQSFPSTYAAWINWRVEKDRQKDAGAREQGLLDEIGKLVDRVEQLSLQVEELEEENQQLKNQKYARNFWQNLWGS